MLLEKDRKLSRLSHCSGFTESKCTRKIVNSISKSSQAAIGEAAVLYQFQCKQRDVNALSFDGRDVCVLDDGSLPVNFILTLSLSNVTEAVVFITTASVKL